MSIASTLGLAEVSKNISKVLRIMILLKCINIMIHFGKCIKYQYHDTILNQVSVSVSRYNLEVSYPTLSAGQIDRRQFVSGFAIATYRTATLTFENTVENVQDHDAAA